MIQTLADLQPVIIVVLLMVMYSMETVIPYMKKPSDKKQHDLHNFILSFISFAVNGMVGIAVLFMVQYTSVHKLGLFNHIQVPQAAEIVFTVMLIDFGSYCFHNLQHKVPFLWRFHRVHHADMHLNASSSLRFHPVEVVLSQGLYFCIAIPLVGASMAGFIIYGTIGLVFVIIQHSNIKFPAWIEKYGRYVFSTPGWHKIHHADEKKLTDSHYGDIFTLWDRIFGTWHEINPEEISYGLKEFSLKERQRAGFLLRSPFLNLNESTGQEADLNS